MPTPDLVIEAPRAVVDGQEQGCTVLVRDGRIAGVEAFGALPRVGRRVRLDDGRAALCMILRPEERGRHQEITEHGGWRAYRASRA
jgi:hypothetical protein